VSEQDAKIRFDDLLEPRFQTHLLAITVQDQGFLARARGILKPEYFNAQVYASVCGALYRYWDKYQKMPSRDTLIVEATRGETSEMMSRVATVIGSLHDTDVTTLDQPHIRDQLVWFGQRAEAALCVGRDHENLRQFDIDAHLREFQRISLLPSIFLDQGLKFREEWPTVFEEDGRRIFPCGYSALDSAMRGGLREGELWCLMCRAKGGKSTVLYNIGAGFLRMGFCVAHITLENYARDVLARYTSLTAQVPTNSLRDHRKEVVQAMDNLSTFTLGDVMIKEFPAGVITDVELDAYLVGLDANEDPHDPRPWVVVLDYADLMRLQPGEEWKAQADNFVRLRNLAKRRRIPILTATQTNAGGFNAPKLGMQHQSGSTRKVFAVEYMWAFDQDEQDYAANRFTLTSLASRNDRQGQKTFWMMDYASGRMTPIDEAAYSALVPEQQHTAEVGTQTGGGRRARAGHPFGGS
jgi:hypothetical protein